MQPIPGWAYIVVGALISGVSWYVRSQKGGTAMLYFFYIGFVFLLIGVVKLTLIYMDSRKDDELAALNMQDSINKAAMTPSQGQMQSPMQAQMQQQQFMQQQQMQQRQGQQQGTSQRPMQQQAQGQQMPLGSSAIKASNLFPFRGVKYAQNPPQGQHIPQAQQAQQRTQQQQAQQQAPPGRRPVRNTPYDPPSQR